MSTSDPSPADAMETMLSRHYRCVVVGNGAIGKTCVIKAINGDAEPNVSEYRPTGRCTAHPTTVTINETQYTIDLWDTPGQEFEHFRGMPDYIDVEEELAYAYALADVFIICFAVCDPESFRDVGEKWYPELQQSRPGIPVILVGTKLDFRDDPAIIEMLRIRDKVPMTCEEGKQMAESIAARTYIECSAKTQEGVARVMDAVACFRG